MPKQSKTNAMRMLDKASIRYQTYTYEHHGEAVDGIHVAQMLHQNPDQVFKTLICIGHSKQYYVFMIPVAETLQLKHAAKAVHEKSVEMIPVKEITKISGYIRGGCSPLGMKKLFLTVLDERAKDYDTIIFSGGKIGLQIACSPQALVQLIHAEYAAICEKTEPI